MAVTVDERRSLLDAVRELAQRQIAPLAAEIDREGRFPHEWVELMREHGVFSLCFDEEYGGTGTGALLKLQAIEEISKVDATAGCCWRSRTWLPSRSAWPGRRSSGRATSRAGRRGRCSPRTP
jgi:alkylation response protein AidB-like acyl-CoA dehydrogenase